MDVRSGCRSADEISPTFVHGDHRLCGIQNHRGETSGGARRTFLRSVQSRDEDAVGTHRLGEEQSAKNKYANKNTSHESPPRGGSYRMPDLMNVN
jgi:hypothetical protein